MRPARALIDLAALAHNYRLARELTGARAVAVVKADAYGHGAAVVAEHLAADADGFAVACLEEALELRAAGIRAPILLLEGFFEGTELAAIVEHDLWTVIHAAWQIELLERAPLRRPLQVWLKMDSGMHRVGFFPHDYAAAYRRLQASGKVADIVKMTHFARADEPDSATTAAQIATFQAATVALPGQTSLSNSPATLAWPTAAGDWIRPGLMLYGATPFTAPHPAASRLQPVMTLTSRIIAVRELNTGEPVGYGARYITPAPTRIGIVALGYADGYPRHAPDGTPVAIAGRPGRLIGRVSMDMLSVDLTDHPQAGVGSEVEFWGAQVSVSQLAERCGTIPYQLLCNLKRVPRRYRR